MTFLEGGGIMKTIKSFFIPSAGRGLRLAWSGIQTVCGLSSAAQSLTIQANGSGLVSPKDRWTGIRFIVPVRLVNPGMLPGRKQLAICLWKFD